MKTKAFVLLSFMAMTVALAAQPLLEDLAIGLNGRTEQNIYRYYNSKGIGNFNTLRVSNGYSAGITVHSSINYLFSAGLGLSLGEASYNPDLERNGSILWSNRMLLWQFDFWGELKLSQNEKSHPILILGAQGMFIEHKRELFSKPGDADAYAWPQQRLMPKIGLGFYHELGRKWQMTPSFGIRIAPKNTVGYDYGVSQFFAGINFAYKIKTW